MTSRQRIHNIIANQPADGCGLWLGNAQSPRRSDIYYGYFKVQTEEELRRKLHDDFRWIAPWTYRGPVKDNPFPIPHKVSHGESVGRSRGRRRCASLNDYDWPKPELMDFEPALAALRVAGDVYRASGHVDQLLSRHDGPLRHGGVPVEHVR